MRLLNGKQGLKRSQFAKELKGADLEKVLLVPIDVSKLIAEALIGNKTTNSKLASGVYKQLQNLTRARRSEIISAPASKNGTSRYP
ncbi:hypothetical protein [Gracilibacillus alcaliphilus]|uniref:hypothetical protein n=1 Tax=Gracilibacillus alcaliphilus TaxID=1401441 RepID=UPI00195E32A0|nr:hypothetical protein [Gracilibacillus alcaliphilus]MBM7676659.1 hypothetical protein [Gracilibacillus alcaliphilus]